MAMEKRKHDDMIAIGSGFERKAGGFKVFCALSVSDLGLSEWTTERGVCE